MWRSSSNSSSYPHPPSRVGQHLAIGTATERSATTQLERPHCKGLGELGLAHTGRPEEQKAPDLEGAQPEVIGAV